MVERRVVSRAKIRTVVQYRSGDGIGSGEVYDISTDGCMLHVTGDVVQEGSSITIRFSDGMRVAGVVIWRRNLTAGIKFAERFQEGVEAVATIQRYRASIEHDEDSSWKAVRSHLLNRRQISRET